MNSPPGITDTNTSNTCMFCNDEAKNNGYFGVKVGPCVENLGPNWYFKIKLCWYNGVIMKSFFNDIKKFVIGTAQDQRIPSRDKKILIALVILIISPIDFIPDWIPLLGLLDDFVYLAIIFNYFFNTLDQRILLSHYPWTMKSYARLQRVAHFFSFFAPEFINNNLWKYSRDPF